MKRFKLSDALKKKATAPVPTELERPVQAKESPIRKWILRIIIFFIFLSIVYFVFRDIFFVEVKGLIKPEKIVVYAPFNGVFISFTFVGSIVEPNKPIGKIYNPEIESEIKALKDTLKLLVFWRKKLKEENNNRKELEKINQEIRNLTQLYDVPNPQLLKKSLNYLYKQRELLIEKEHQLRRRLIDVKKLVKIGAATKLDLEAIELKLLKIETDINTINSEISKLEDKIKRAEELKKYLKETAKVVDVNPLLPNLSSIDSEISSIEERIQKLSAKVNSEFISFPFKVKVASLIPSGSYVIKGTQVASVFNLNNYYVIAYVPPDRLKRIYIGEYVKVILPNGKKLKGIVSAFKPSLVLKPATLVGPLEKRSLVLPVKIKILLEDKEVRKIVYENMPVTVIFNK